MLILEYIPVTKAKKPAARYHTKNREFRPGSCNHQKWRPRGGYGQHEKVEILNSAGKERPATEARRVLCYIAVRKLGYKCTEVSKAMGISAVTVSKAVSLGRELPDIDKIHKQMLAN